MKMKKWVYNTLVIISGLVFTVSACMLADYIIGSLEQQQQYDDLSQLVQQNTPTYAPTDPSHPSDPTDPTGTTGDAADPTEPTPPPPVLVDVVDPETGKTVQVLQEYAEIYKLNNDLVGWIRIPGTRVNYPVMQTPDSPDYYLDRDFYGKPSRQGAIYAREVCDIAEPSDNITLYGHHMQDGSMFADIMDYQHKSFYPEHQYLTFDTLTEHHTYQVIACFKTTATVGQGFKYHGYVDFYSEAQFNEFMRMVKGYDFYDTGVTAEFGDKLICLSTCEYTLVNGRLVVVAKRIS